MAHLLVTGATGFVGRHLVPVLTARGHTVSEAVRRPREGAGRLVLVGEIGPDTDWRTALAGIDAVIHLAGLAHSEDATEAAYFAVNDVGTCRLAEACQAAGVRTMVSVSSIAAREAERSPERANAYGRSKLAGEAHMRAFAEAGGTGIVLRPPLVYGPDAPGNWQKLQRLASGGLPLPLGAVWNRRSFCSVGNLCHAIATAAEAALQGTGGGTYEIADRETVSLTRILTWLRAGMGRPARLVPVPCGLLRLAGKLSGREKLVAALLDDLVLDPSSFMRVFAWSPPEATGDAVVQAGRLYAERARIRKPASAEP